MAVVTMTIEETPVVFGVGSDHLVGIATRAPAPSEVGVMIMVGGRQYRAGSHRQFVLLARRLARAGYSVFRFDFRGMGDSTGRQRSFEEVDEDLATAIATFQANCPSVRRIVLWGLCDAATAAVLYWWRCRDERIAGMCLVNPWLRSAAGLARTRVRHYYRERIFAAEFWRKLVRGQVAPIRSLGEYLANRQAGKNGQFPEFQRNMISGMNEFPGPLLLLLSGRDLTAKEFLDRISEAHAVAPLLQESRLRRIDIADADHTFSSERWRNEAEEAVVNWLGDMWSVEATTAASHP